MAYNPQKNRESERVDGGSVFEDTSTPYSPRTYPYMFAGNRTVPKVGVKTISTSTHETSTEYGHEYHSTPTGSLH